MIELRIALQPKQKQFLRSVEENTVTFYGGAKGGGKSKGLRDIMLIRRLKYPGTTGGLFRKSYKELEGNHIRPLLKEYPVLNNYWNDSKKILTLPNRSTLEFCYCETDRDLELYQGREYNDLGIEEAGQWKENSFRTLQGSNRSSVPGVPARTMLTGNPGGLGHAWLKRLFINRHFKPEEIPGDYHFVKATVYDNPALLENDPGYLNKLKANPNEMLRRAFLDGDWDIHAGQFFSEIRRDVHFISAFTIPDHWTRFGAYDYGFNHPAAFGWFACDEDGNVYLYREFIKAQLRVDQYAAELNKHHDTKKLEYVKGGHDCWVQKGILKANGNPPTVAEEFYEHGISLSRATIDRIQGAAHLRKYLAWQELANGRTKPRFFIFNTCPITYECLSTVQVDPDRVEDVLKQDATEGDPLTGDDPYDMVRYGLMSRPWAAEMPKQILKPGSMEYLQDVAKRLEDDIDRQGQIQMAQENEDDIFTISETDGESDALRHYVNKKKGLM